MRALYVVGPPGVGKTTAVNGAFPALGAPEKVGELMWVQPIRDGLRLGRDRASFGGTDALGMAVHPEACRWAEWAPLPDYVVGEGQRLATRQFLGTLAQRGGLRVVHLVADPEVLAERRRGRTQNAAWVRGSETKAARIAAQMGAITIDTTGLYVGTVQKLLADLMTTGVSWAWPDD